MRERRTEGICVHQGRCRAGGTCRLGGVIATRLGVGFNALGTHYTDVIHVAEDLIIIQAVSHDKEIRNAEAHEVAAVAIPFGRALLQQRRRSDAQWLEALRAHATGLGARSAQSIQAAACRVRASN